MKLPRGTWPRAIVFDDRGTLWIAESSADAIAERRRDGRVIQHRLEATETSIDDMVPRPDGNVWFQGFQLVGWITPAGQVAGYQLGQRPELGSPSAMAIGPDGNIWYASESVPPTIKRITDGGVIRTYPLPADDAGLELPGITAGPDGALWFTQSPVGSEGPPEAIGRLEPDGSYTRHPLPHQRSGPRRITAGPDGALWFTEQSRHRIGRISTSGAIREFPLAPGTVPAEIVSGSDGALWFTAQRSIGRITTRGDVRMWPIPNARPPYGLAEDRDGTFWVSDPEADTLHHFDPRQS